MKHTLESIAKLAGVSRGTVSRVVNRQPGVKPDVREHVRRVIEQAGYHPHPQARSLAGGKTESIGVVVFGQQSHFLTHHIFYEVLQGIQCHPATNEYDLLLFSNRSETDADYWKRIGTRRKVDGLIVMGERIRREYLSFYRELKIPFVLVGKREFGDLPLACVTSNYRSGAYEAASHLLRQGRRTIVYIAGIPDSYHENERLKGYRQAIEEAGLSFDPSLILHGNAEQEEAGRQLESLLASGRKVDGIFAGNDLMAFGAIEQLNKRGLAVPSDIAVIGYDDIQASAHCSPPLTTIRQDKIGLGRAATEQLMKMLRGEIAIDSCQDTILDNRLVIRGSA